MTEYKQRENLGWRYLAALLVLGGALLVAKPAPAQTPGPLSAVPVPKPANLDRFVADEQAAIRLGKALFWDMQVGSDGMTACASCHFHAGTDNRLHNTLHPGPDGTFDEGSRVNDRLSLDDFPFVAFEDDTDRFSPMIRDRDDRVGAQGVPRTRFLGVIEGQADEPGRHVRDATFERNARNVRQVTNRSTPTVINAVFNFANFWDGRANHFFNGVDPFGVQNPGARVYINTANGLSELDLTSNPLYLLDNASLASQSVGPPRDTREMSWVGRQWPDIGRKMLSLQPLGKQAVHPQDSVLGLIANARTTPGAQGLNATYAAMIQQAFRPEFWNGVARIEGYTQMERNFSLYFGLSVMLYQATLVSDDTPFDRFVAGDALALSESAQRGLNRFQSGGVGCLNCHVGSEFTGASVTVARDPAEAGLIEIMNMGDGGPASYDIGFYNIAVSRFEDDPGRGGVDPFGNPLSFSEQRQALNRGETLGFDQRFVPDEGCVPDLFAEAAPLICPPNLGDIERVSVQGAFKTPGLRNIELTGPYMHNGSMATLMQVMDFYNRGGNFHEHNIDFLDPFIIALGLTEEEQINLVDFMLALTDERVRWERAPFDHPQLFIVDGHEEQFTGNPKRSRVLVDRIREIPAIGRFGREVEGLGPLKPFLADDLEGEELANFHYRP
ncbi:cytochrome-c peroxidase [Geoalkalibacter sp.]|uniref:cytochrome-c peroxidase n=1 Tax=Geoalkalibacter sp. TaxID=3041440 RepID=UPI00272E0556|nr:cytochrome c peroxidase [Geoalkalibacter sp.]